MVEKFGHQPIKNSYEYSKSLGDLMREHVFKTLGIQQSKFKPNVSSLPGMKQHILIKLNVLYNDKGHDATFIKKKYGKIFGNFNLIRSCYVCVCV